MSLGLRTPFVMFFTPEFLLAIHVMVVHHVWVNILSHIKEFSTPPCVTWYQGMVFTFSGGCTTYFSFWGHVLSGPVGIESLWPVLLCPRLDPCISSTPHLFCLALWSSDSECHSYRIYPRIRCTFWNENWNKNLGKYKIWYWLSLRHKLWGMSAWSLGEFPAVLSNMSPPKLISHTQPVPDFASHNPSHNILWILFCIS